MVFKGTSGTMVEDQLWGADRGRLGTLQLFFNILRCIHSVSILQRYLVERKRERRGRREREGGEGNNNRGARRGEGGGRDANRHYPTPLMLIRNLSLGSGHFSSEVFKVRDTQSENR